MAISDYKVVDDFLMGPPALSDTQSKALFPLGIKARAVNFSATGSSIFPQFAEFVYAQGSNVASAGQFVQVWNGSAVVLAAANSASFFPVGVAAGLLSATNAYGWVQVDGYVDYAKGTNSAIAAGVPLYVAAGTAGYLVTNVVAGNHVQGVVAPVSYTSSQSNSLTVQLFRPFIAGLTASL